MNTKQLVVILSTLAAIVLLYLLPTKSSSTVEMPKTDTKSMTVDEKIEEAVHVMETNPMPMAGIEMLKEVLVEDPYNKRALGIMASSCMKTNQFEKAIGYTSKLIEIEPNNVQWRAMISNSYLGVRDTTEALSSFRILKTMTTDSTIVNRIDELLNQLENN